MPYKVTQFQPGHRMSKLGKQNFWVVTSFFASEQCYFYSVVNILLTEFRQNIEYEHCTALFTYKMVTIIASYFGKKFTQPAHGTPKIGQNESV